MKTLKFATEQEWLEARIGKITGSRLKDILVKRGTKPKIGFYELIAEKMAVPPTDEKPMDRGHRLEEIALQEFTMETGLELDTSLIMWVSDKNENIAVSPDAEVIGLPEAVEAKCLSSARHLQAYLTQEIPDEYEEQAIQYFIVNQDLKKLHFAFYDDRLIAKQFFIITLYREEYDEKISQYEDYQEQILMEVNDIVAQLSM